jgi:hypothetical protein
MAIGTPQARRGGCPKLHPEPVTCCFVRDGEPRHHPLVALRLI